ncbi:MAG: hypothetical protein HXL51_02365 [Solobacterium sp.]|jgi:hypothetical protein|nr:hypothetical protein [uncultured Solobacterium sp.]MBF1090618.1 hypothetical protein [Solobacterium sp.]MBF1122854.1 hypothetical protein [Solobacterium sp.]DAU25235.1 MAG TPA: hypothetical protein [Caudoviricetes sp.]
MEKRREIEMTEDDFKELLKTINEEDEESSLLEENPDEEILFYVRK